jgi:hypothetical protein
MPPETAPTRPPHAQAPATESKTEELVRRLCRSAATRALLAGSLAGCGHTGGSLEPSSATRESLADREAARADESDAAAEEGKVEPLPEFALDEPHTPRNYPVDEDPRVAPPLSRADAPNLVSSDEPEAFPCGGTPQPHGPLHDESILIRRMAAWDRSRFNAQARGLHVGIDTDYLEVNYAALRRSVMASEAPEIQFERVARAGSPCAGAKDREQCVARLDALRTETEASLRCSTHACKEGNSTYGLLTRGDRVEVLRTPAAFRALLGPIDTPVDAWLMLMAQRALPPLQCDSPEYSTHRAVPGGYELTVRKLTSYCVIDVSPATEKDFVYRVDREGKYKQRSVKLVYTSTRCVVSGRRPAGLAWMEYARSADAPRPASRTAGATFARMAELEWASIAAFRQLARELRAMGAPSMLLARIRRAAREEIRHTRAMSALAAAHGALPREPVVPNDSARGALALALDNVGEGCVRELFGAMLAHVQKERAVDPEVRAVFSAIADDEASHAALALDIQRFLGTQLSEEEREQVEGARRAALAGLALELAEPSHEERELCGLPTLAQAQVLLAVLAEAGLGLVVPAVA